MKKLLSNLTSKILNARFTFLRGVRALYHHAAQRKRWRSADKAFIRQERHKNFKLTEKIVSFAVNQIKISYRIILTFKWN